MGTLRRSLVAGPDAAEFETFWRLAQVAIIWFTALAGSKHWCPPQLFGSGGGNVISLRSSW